MSTETHPYAESYEDRHPKVYEDDLDWRPLIVILACVAVCATIAVSWILWGPPIVAPFVRS